MSAYQCDETHIAQLADLLTLPWGGLRSDSIVRLEARETVEQTAREVVFAELWRENARSVAYRYREDEIPAPDAPRAWLDPRAARFTHREDFTARVVKAVSCYVYQSCEHPGWDSSRAKAWCDALIMAAAHELPGYEAADWGAPFGGAR